MKTAYRENRLTPEHDKMLITLGIIFPSSGAMEPVDKAPILEIGQELKCNAPEADGPVAESRCLHFPIICPVNIKELIEKSIVNSHAVVSKDELKDEIKIIRPIASDIDSEGNRNVDILGNN